MVCLCTFVKLCYVSQKVSEKKTFLKRLRVKREKISCCNDLLWPRNYGQTSQFKEINASDHLSILCLFRCASISLPSLLTRLPHNNVPWYLYILTMSLIRSYHSYHNIYTITFLNLCTSIYKNLSIYISIYLPYLSIYLCIFPCCVMLSISATTWAADFWAYTFSVRPK